MTVWELLLFLMLTGTLGFVVGYWLGGDRGRG